MYVPLASVGINAAVMQTNLYQYQIIKVTVLEFASPLKPASPGVVYNEVINKQREMEEDGGVKKG